MPKKKSPDHGLITNHILKNIPKKAVTYITIVYAIQFPYKNWILFDRVENSHIGFDKKNQIKKVPTRITTNL